MNHSQNEHALALLVRHTKIQTQDHTCIQIVTTPDGTPLNFDFEGTLITSSCLLINAGVSYSCDSVQHPVLIIYVDARAYLGKQLKTQIEGSYTDISDMTGGLLSAVPSKEEIHQLLSLFQSKNNAVIRDERVRKMMRYIRLHSEKKVELEEAAKLVLLSPDHARHIFAEQTGILFSQYVLWLRMKWALHYILKEQFSFSDAISKAGFSDQPHFTHMFRKTFGTTPMKIKKYACLIET